MHIERHKSRGATALLATLIAVGVGCSSGLGTSGGSGTAENQAQQAMPLGLDFGFDLTQGIHVVDVAGAVIPGVTPEDDRHITLLALSTAAAANDADGLGTALVKDAAPPSDTNGTSDVFVLAIEDETVDGGELGDIPTGFARAIAHTMRHDRCVHCHSMGTAAGPGEELAFPNAPHPGGAEPITSDAGCADCHNAAAVPALAGIEWRAPLEANGDFDFRGLSNAELAAKAMSEPLVEHLLNDGRVRWAIDSGSVPFVTPRPGGNAGTSALWNGLQVDKGAVPISFALFSAQLEAWRDAGFPLGSPGAVRDVVLLSESPFTGAAANGESTSPALTWIPNPAYDPNDPSAAPAGEIVVVYASRATNLTAGGDTTSDIYLSRAELFVDQDPATSATLAGALDLVVDPSETELISLSSAGGSTNGASINPDIDAAAELVVYDSVATNIVAGFNDLNGGGSDVFCRNRVTDENYLVSATVPGGTTSGNGASSTAKVSAIGRAIAFQSTASNLVAGDTNGDQDIFYAPAAGATLLRASLNADGTQGEAGDCRGAAIAVRENGNVVVAFTSAKTLAGDTNVDDVFLHENGTTTLLSQIRAGSAVTQSDDFSFAVALDPLGARAAYSTLATNLDSVRPDDGNGMADVILVDLASVRSSGNVRGQRISVDPYGQTASNGASTAELAGFRTADGGFEDQALAILRTDSEELGFTRENVVTRVLDAGATVLRTDFTADVTAGPPSLTVTFSDLSEGAISARSWDFGDGTTSTQTNPTHTYDTIGTYDVTLTVTRNGATDIASKSAYVRVLEPVMITGVGASDTTGPIPFQTTFDATFSGSTDELTYAWNFGDGATSTEASPTHTYTTVGTFDVSLAVSGLSGSDMATANGLITTIPPSGANFTFSRAGLRVSFTDQSSGTITSRLWDFGDGDTSTAANPTHDYDDNGTYVVTLTVNGPGGMDDESRSVTTNARPFSDVYALMSPNGCFSCHGSSSPSGGLTLSAGATTAYNELVGVLAEGAACANGSRRRVVRFNTSSSLLLQTVTPGSGACNSGAGGMPTWSSASDRAVLSDWISDGAARN